MDVSVTRATTQIGCTVLIFLLTWRLWRFTIRPKFHPLEPKGLPYWMPFIGHATGFFFGFNDAIEYGRKYFAPSKELFAMTVAGQTIYVATSPEDINNVWKNTKTISMDPITMDMYIWTGLSKASRDAMFENNLITRRHEGRKDFLSPTQIVIELHHQQLRNGPRLEALMRERVLPEFLGKLCFRELYRVRGASISGKTCKLSLSSLCHELFIAGGTNAYFGPELLRAHPGLLDAFQSWEQCNWKFLFQLPDILSKDMLHAKDVLGDTFTHFYQLPKGDRANSVFFINELEDILRKVGLSKTEMGRFTLLHYWA